MNAERAEDVLEKNGWRFKNGWGYINYDVSMYDRLEEDHVKAINYMHHEFDCCFTFRENKHDFITIYLEEDAT